MNEIYSMTATVQITACYGGTVVVLFAYLAVQKDVFLKLDIFSDSIFSD